MRRTQKRSLSTTSAEIGRDSLCHLRCLLWPSDFETEKERNTRRWNMRTTQGMFCWRTRRKKEEVSHSSHSFLFCRSIFLFWEKKQKVQTPQTFSMNEWKSFSFSFRSPVVCPTPVSSCFSVTVIVTREGDISLLCSLEVSRKIGWQKCQVSHMW